MWGEREVKIEERKGQGRKRGGKVSWSNNIGVLQGGERDGAGRGVGGEECTVRGEGGAGRGDGRKGETKRREEQGRADRRRVEQGQGV